MAKSKSVTKAEKTKLIKYWAEYKRFGDKVNIKQAQKMYDRFFNYLDKLQQKYPDYDMETKEFWDGLSYAAEKYQEKHLMLGPGQTFGCRNVGYMADFYKTEKKTPVKKKNGNGKKKTKIQEVAFIDFYNAGKRAGKAGKKMEPEHNPEFIELFRIFEKSPSVGPYELEEARESFYEGVRAGQPKNGKKKKEEKLYLPEDIEKPKKHTGKKVDTQFGEVEIISAYTRQQAIEDGQQYLLDPKLAKEAGFKIPIYMTSGVHSLLEKVENNKRVVQDYKGVLWDILTMLMYAVKSNPDTDFLSFRVKIIGAGRKKNYDFYAQIGPIDIDNPSPALTIMLKEEY